ncbi:hypothetical protein EC957_003719 [Mortierella hygrophila]|uniref:Uncharacterized protein n=1 Tax=Mortierella hygrophila TaxID=979708 RepID=A0A9P6F1H0_9FUNG|nr:hypothetical protein EC957_003719 [Mortierella hygrophila]
MPRRICNKDVQENSEAESDDDDIYQEEDRDESTSPTLSQSPSQSPSPTPSLSPLPETPPPRRTTRSTTTKVKKAVAIIPKTPKTPKTPRAIVTRTRVIKETTASGRGDHADADMESVGDTESETGPQLLKTPTTKKPRPRTKKEAVTGRGKAHPEGGEVESEGDVKSVKKPTPKKPRAKTKGRGAEDQPVEGEFDAKPVKTITSKRSRAKSEKSRAASEQARTPATPKKPRAPRPKKIMKASAAVAATTPLIASIQENDDGGGSFVGLPSKVSFPLDSIMDGIETYRSAAGVLKTSNWDCEMMAMPLQEQTRFERCAALEKGNRPNTFIVNTKLPRKNQQPSFGHFHALCTPLATIEDVTKTVDKTYDVASQNLLGAMRLTRRALEDQAHAIQFHTVAFQVFGQGLLMTESQCQILFPQEQFADLATRSVLSLLPSLQAPSASAVTPPSFMFVPQAQANTSAQDENLLINVVSNMRRGLESPLGQSGYGPAMTRSLSYSSYIPSSGPFSPTFPSPPSTPTRCPMAAPIPIQHSVASTVPWLSSSDFANDSVQPSIFAHDRQGFPITTPPPRSSLSSAQASEPLYAPCISTSLSAMMSAENQHSSLHALKEARRKALYEHFQRRHDESATRDGTHGRQRDLTPSQQQESRLVMSTLAGQPEHRIQQPEHRIQQPEHRIQQPEHRIQQQYEQQQYEQQYEQQQYDQLHNHEVETGYLKTTAVVGEETRIKDEGPRQLQVQLTSSLWSEVKERSTNLYLKAVKSYEDSRSADRIASESNDQFMEASKRWYALIGHAFPYD